MRTTVKGKNIDVADRDRRYAQQKLRRLDRMLDDRSEALVELSLEGHRSLESSHIADVTLIIDGRTVRGTSSGATYQAAIDDVIDTLERRTVDHRERPRDRRRSSGSALRTPEPAERPEPGERLEPGDGPHIVKVKRFAIEPMFEEDAISRMEELGHSFFVFVNAESERVAVLYRRRDGRYGLIEPTIGGEYTTDMPS